MSDHWKVLRIQAGTLAPEALEELVALLQAVLPVGGAHEARTEEGSEWRLFFEPDEVPDGLEARVRAIAAESGLEGFRLAGLMDVARENWQENWRQYFKPVRLSPTLEIRPSWFKPGSVAAGGGDQAPVPPEAGVTVLYIEPGMAFGTGTHATTQLCLRQVERLVRPGGSVLDCGTGSAILAIAAVRRGAGRVVGFDIDPEVEENARLNLELNDLPADAVEIRIGGLDSVRAGEAFDVIFCNMLSREFLPLLPDLPRYLEPEGRLVLSGLLRTEEEEIRHAAERAGLRVIETDGAEEWAALVCAR